MYNLHTMEISEISKELGVNFIEYAAAVNSDRAIPDSRDGLKPVAKRILYGAYNVGYTSSKPHVKCAKVVGEVMGSWHPHGDSSIYGALVRLAQPWILRYPLIDFHGNMGNIGGDGPAHMRYTESRTSKLTEEGMLFHIKKKNVNFIPNYDEKEQEPEVLPAIFPNLLCNPNSGIGVSLACNWACHNLNEVAASIYDYMDGKEPMLPGPDFPTGGVIINKDDIPMIMKTGRGSVKIRGKHKIEKQNIIFYEIPYGTTTENLINEIGEVCDKKEIEGIKEVRNESGKRIRIVIECEKGINPESIAKKLFAKTNLQTSFSYNQVALVDKTPTELNLKDCIRIYIDHNVNCLIKETQYDIKKAEERKEIVEGLLKALANIEDIIVLIKKSDSSARAKERLILVYGFTENQAKAILAMRLSSLAKLEGVELEQELKGLLTNLTELNKLISNKDSQLAEIKLRLQNIVKKYGDARRTELVQIEVPKEEKEIEEIIPEDVVVILTQTGYVKRIPKTSFKVQRKGGKGVKNKDDTILASISTNTIDNLLLFTSKGKMYKLLVDNIPVGTNISKGTNIATLINMETDEKIIAATSLQHKTNAKYVVFFTKKGLMKKTLLEEYTKVKRSTGIAAIKIKEGDSLANVTFVDKEDIIIITKNGMSIHFESREVAPIGRVTSGVKAIKLNEEDEVLVGLPIFKDSDCLCVFTERGFAKKCILDEFPVQLRGGKGVTIYKPSEVTGNICGALISKDDNILLVGKPNSICISSNDIPLLSRIGMGNIVMKGNIISAVKL